MRLIRPSLFLATALGIPALAAAPAFAGSTIEIVNAWSRPTIPARPGAAYLEIRNTGDAPDRLLGARAGLASKVELHESAMQGGMMTMHPVAGLDIPAGGSAVIEPGGFHLMLFGIDPPLKEGDTVELTLTFESAGDVTLPVPVRRAGNATRKMDGQQMQHQMQHNMPSGQSQGTTGNWVPLRNEARP